MSASYPASVKSFATHVDVTETVSAAHVNDLQAEVVSIETYLGINAHVSTTGSSGGGTSGVWTSSSKTYASISARVANNEAGVLRANTHADSNSAVHGIASGFVGLTDTQSLSNKTLVTPTIASYINAGHDHSNAAGGGNIPQASVTGLVAALAAKAAKDGSTAFTGPVTVTTGSGSETAAAHVRVATATSNSVTVPQLQIGTPQFGTTSGSAGLVLQATDSTGAGQPLATVGAGDAALSVQGGSSANLTRIATFNCQVQDSLTNVSWTLGTNVSALYNSFYVDIFGRLCVGGVGFSLSSALSVGSTLFTLTGYKRNPGVGATFHLIDSNDKLWRFSFASFTATVASMGTASYTGTLYIPNGEIRIPWMYTASGNPISYQTYPASSTVY